MKPKKKSRSSTRGTSRKEKKNLLEGTVLSVLGKGYTVNIDGEVWKCRVRGRLFLGERSTRPVAGDRVIVEPRKEPLVGVINEINTRRSVLARRSPEFGTEQVLAANIDQVLICMAIKQPPFRPGLIDRYLITCEAFDLEAILIVNKVDLASDEEFTKATREFVDIGYQVMPASALTGEGVQEIKEMLQGSCSVLTGPSGAGKSSLTNAIEPGAQLLTGEVNTVTGKGRHTTTASQLIPFAGGFLMDTPGIREFAPWGIEPQDLAACFKEFRPYLGQCQFRDCKHMAEPNCMIKECVEDQTIHPRRYQSYLQLMEEFLEDAKPF